MAQYLEIMELQSYLEENNIVFVLEISLLDQQFAILDKKSGLHHILQYLKYLSREMVIL